MFIQREIGFIVRTKLQIARWHLYNNDSINAVTLNSDLATDRKYIKHSKTKN